MIKNLLYNRLKKLGACSAGLNEYKGKSMKEVWETIDNAPDFFWLLIELKNRGYLDGHPAIHSYYLGFKQEVFNALDFADPKPTTRRTRVRGGYGKEGRECIEALQQLFTFRQVSRALAKIKV